VTEIDKAVEHAWTLFREHVERYRTEIHCEPLAWRRRRSGANPPKQKTRRIRAGYILWLARAA
jgi:hypothetical protein